MDNVEDVIKHIISMDQNAYNKKMQTEKQILEQDEDFQQAADVISQEMIDKARQEAAIKYATEIEKQMQEIKERDIKTTKAIQAIQLKYKQVEENICKRLFSQMFSLEE